MLEVLSALLDLFYPPRCPACRSLVGEEGFCRACRETLTDLPLAHCPRCAEPEVEGLCAHCRAVPPAFESVVAPCLHGGALADAIHRFKYEDRPQLARPLAALARPCVAEALAWCDLVCPVPLHDERLRQRGYDQALLVARELARSAGRPVEARALRRTRKTAPQVGRDRAGRAANVAGAFEADRFRVAGKRVLLVDDVVTTGATANAAARALLEGGAAAVRVAALARALGRG
jgi:ComF family protein